jgi:hypothetical protein
MDVPKPLGSPKAQALRSYLWPHLRRKHSCPLVAEGCRQGHVANWQAGIKHAQ